MSTAREGMREGSGEREERRERERKREGGEREGEREVGREAGDLRFNILVGCKTLDKYLHGAVDNLYQKHINYSIYMYMHNSDGRYQNFPLSIIARLIATIMAIIAIPTAKCRNQKKRGVCLATVYRFMIK